MVNQKYTDETIAYKMFSIERIDSITPLKIKVKK